MRWSTCVSMCVNIAAQMTASSWVSTSTLISVPVLDCTPLLSGAALDEAAATRLAGLLRILADPARLRILSLLQAQSSREACVCHVTEFLGLGQPTVSHHLRVLFEAGLVQRERRGNWVYYRAVPGALDGLRVALGGAADSSQQGSGSPSAACGDDCRCQ
jgi:ArsR family transcriptional regulator, arsenate/arsenite/antimonite-responsive transcriptional repressor